MKTIRSVAFLLLAGSMLSVVPAVAQPLGAFRWQLQPYCNIVTVAVVQQGGQYLLDGTDDQCGAAQAASVRGMAFQNPNGSIGFGLTIGTAPGGTTVHVDATISIASLGGTWRDSAGNSGTFVFTPGGSVGGGPRPVPSGGLAPASVTTIQVAAGAITNAKLSADAVNGSTIADGSITTADLAAPPILMATPMPAGAVINLGFNWATVRSLTLTIRAPGQVLVNASGVFELVGSGNIRAECAILSGANPNPGEQLLTVVAPLNGASATTFAGARVYPVTPGSFTVNLACNGGVLGTVNLWTPALSALFIPS